MSENYGFLMHTISKLNLQRGTITYLTSILFIKNINRIMQSLNGFVTFMLNVHRLLEIKFNSGKTDIRISAHIGYKIYRRTSANTFKVEKPLFICTTIPALINGATCVQNTFFEP